MKTMLKMSAMLAVLAAAGLGLCACGGGGDNKHVCEFDNCSSGDVTVTTPEYGTFTLKPDQARYFDEMYSGFGYVATNAVCVDVTTRGDVFFHDAF